MLVITAAMLWGVSGTVAQYLFQKKEFTPEWLVVIRLLISGIVLLIYSSIKGKQDIFESIQDKNPREIVTAKLVSEQNNKQLELSLPSCFFAGREAVEGAALLGVRGGLAGLAIGNQRLGALHEADGQIVEINDKEVTLAHGPFKTLGMPGMTMTFPLAAPALMKDLKTGDKVRIAVSQTEDGLRVERLERSGSQP